MLYKTLLAISACTFYLVATVLITLHMRRPAQLTPASYVSPVTALLLHALLIYQLVFIAGGLNLSFFNSLCMFAWLTTFGGIIINLRNRLESLGLFLYPVSIISIVLAVIFYTPAPEMTNPPIYLQIHIISSIFAYCILSIAALLSIVLAIQDYQLHHHKPGRITASLPPLQTVEKLLFQVITMGFLLLTLSLLTGFMFTDDWFNHKIIFSCLAWGVFLVLLFGRHLAGWRGKTAIRWTLGGIVSLMLAFFGTKLVLEIILSP